MNTLAISDLTLSIALDRKALNKVVGGDTWIQNSVSTSYSGWTWARTSYTGLGTVNVNGVRNVASFENWKRTRTQTESSSWYHYVVA